jgi:glycosyltransferase involved in cell wall biosynthesis
LPTPPREFFAAESEWDARTIALGVGCESWRSPELKLSLPSLLVFADDWGRHPSSCQHLVRQLLGRYQVFWVNTIGTRPPRLNLATVRRSLEKVRQWLWSQAPESGPDLETGPGATANLQVLNPRMWPWFRSPLDRRINRALLSRQLVPLLGRLNPPALALTTLPIVSDLLGALPVQRWIYYCVDDFGEWPGLDSRPLRRMEIDLVRRADRLLAVSETLRQKLARMGRGAALLTHGVDVEFWRRPTGDTPQSFTALERPLIVFWGVVDRRMDLALLRRLTADLGRGTVVLAGPEDDPDPNLATLPRTVRLGSLPFASLPHLAREAAVLIMPYADLPVTRAMQPLKFKEYLATGRPVVARALPATQSWADCADLTTTPETFSEAVLGRLSSGLPESQRVARSRLDGESWAEKARQLENWAFDATPNVCPGSADVSSGTRRAPRPAGPPVVLEVRVVRGSGGGPDKTILNSPRFLTPLGYRTLCAYMHPPDDPGFAQLQAKARAWGAPLLSVPDRGFWDLGVIPRLLNICRRERVAVWHGHDYKSNALGLLLRRLWPMKLITTVHGWVHHTARTPLYYWLDRLCLRYYDLVLCVSQDLCDCALQSGVPAERCVLIENAIDTREFARTVSTAEARRRLGLRPDGLVIGGVGRLSAEKGFDLLIAATDQLLRAGVDVDLLIIGEGGEKKNLETLIDRLGRRDRIRLLGYRSDTTDLYQALDVFALSSLREGLPNVLLEAMAFEVPVVATRIAGVPRLITDGENGLLVEPAAVDATAEALGRLLADPALHQRLGRAGRRTIEERHSFEDRMKKVAAIFDGLLRIP